MFPYSFTGFLLDLRSLVPSKKGLLVVALDAGCGFGILQLSWHEVGTNELFYFSLVCFDESFHICGGSETFLQ